MLMVPGVVAGTGGAVELQAITSSSVNAHPTRFMTFMLRNYYRSLAEVEKQNANERASREGGPVVVRLKAAFFRADVAPAAFRLAAATAVGATAAAGSAAVAATTAAA